MKLSTDIPRAERQEKRRQRRALKAARRHMADPNARLPRLLEAYSKFQAQGSIRWALPDS
ncbi:MAG: hypothetical protein AAF092_00730 [Pseudomonadota bacterium]